MSAILTILDGVRGWSRWDGEPASLAGIVETAVALSFATLETRTVAGIEPALRSADGRSRGRALHPGSN
jgi:hypothetical protein